MLVLLDENLLSRKLKQPITAAGYSVFNVDNMGWRGTKDRDLLVLADAYPFPANFASWVSPNDRSEQQLQLQTSKPWWKIW
jgi:hypothetical protein